VTRATETTFVVDVRVLDSRLDLSRKECWLLYVWLGQSAPFVRNQLSVVRNGGSATICISSREEARQVLSAIATGGADPAALTHGLRSLRAALGGSGAGEAT
jgi:hypothetical protein